MRRYVYHDADNLDTAFDAGGKVSIGLTATTIVSQWTWSATLLQSSTVASKVRHIRSTHIQWKFPHDILKSPRLHFAVRPGLVDQGHARLRSKMMFIAPFTFAMHESLLRPPR